MKLRFLVAAFTLLALAFPQTSFASTECSGTLSNIYAGDNGRIYLFMSGGPNGYFENGNPNAKNALSLATAAMLAGKRVRLRFTASGVACVWQGRSDLEGIWLDQ